MSLRSKHYKSASLGQETGLQRSSSRRHSLQSFFKNNASKLRKSSNARKCGVASVAEEPKLQNLAQQDITGSNEKPGASYLTAGQYSDAERCDKNGDERKILSSKDMTRIFDGAPKFEVVASIGSDSDRPTHEASARLLDHTRFGHPTFSAATLQQEEEEQTPSLDAHVLDIPKTTCSTTFAPTLEDLGEVPDMTGLNGNEVGSVGLEYFLQLPIADSKLTSALDENECQKKRQILLSSPKYLGLRPFDLQYIIYRLGELGDDRQSPKFEPHQRPNQQKSVEMYEDLFSKLLLIPRHHTVADTYSSGLDAQIDALIHVLNMSSVWFDFSLVENRIRLGQMLWPSSESNDLDSVDLEEAKDDIPTPASERDVVLLQVILASELLIRLEMSQSRVTSKKIRWDLVLALRFLENIRIAFKSSTGDGPSYRNSVLSTTSFVTACESLDDETNTEPIFYPRQEQRQIDGLLHFAETLGWPHKAEITERFSERTRRHPRQTEKLDAYATPSASPPTQESYFGTPKRPQISRTATAQSVQLLPASVYGSKNFDLGGWLTRSWLTGLVLPGETTSHLLISTLLENSPAAVVALGDSANLYEGFVYQARSYWSKSCIVGRVMAATNGASDCMGWISCDKVPVGHGDGWVNLEVKDVVHDTTKETYDSAFVPKNKSSTITKADFTWPSDSAPPSDISVTYHGFNLLPSTPSLEADLIKDGNQTLTAMSKAMATLNFSTRESPGIVTIPLMHDIQFISAALCFPPTSRRPSLSRALSSNPVSTSKERISTETPPCHPLHSSYTTTNIPAASLLAQDFDDTVHLGDDILVLDCRGEGELRLLARAWCAKVGESAVVGRVGTTCISCCVREARAADVKIVLRV